MKAVIQRVDSASVSVDGKTVGSVGKGFLVLFGAQTGDSGRDCEKLAAKICGLRIFSDEQGKINRSLKDVGGGLLVISQFTLLADCKKGNRPSFLDACEPEKANRLYEYFCELCEKEIPRTERGIFGADMSVKLTNDGPFTIILECKNGEIL